MALIFDSFRTREDAEKFAATITKKYRVRANVYDTQQESEPKDISEIFGPDPYRNGVKDDFPFRLIPPIVLVERSEKTDDAVSAFGEQYGGRFAGT